METGAKKRKETDTPSERTLEFVKTREVIRFILDDQPHTYTPNQSLSKTLGKIDAAFQLFPSEKAKKPLSNQSALAALENDAILKLNGTTYILRKVEEEKFHTSEYEQKSSPEASEDDAVFWFKYMRKAILERNPIPSLKLELASSEELELTPEEINQLRTHHLRPKFFVRDSSGAIWFVKVVQRDTAEREIACNQVLRDRAKPKGLKMFLTSEFEFEGKMLKDAETKFWFLVFPYVKGFTLQKAIRDNLLTESELLNGLLQVVHGLVMTNPSLPLTSETVRFYHRDFKPDQIMVDRHTKKFYISDFGLSQVEYLEGIRKVTVSSSSSSAYADDVCKVFLPVIDAVSEEKRKELRQAFKSFQDNKVGLEHCETVLTRLAR